MQKKTKSVVSLVTAALFVLTQALTPLPAWAAGEARAPEVRVSGQFELVLPPDLGTIQTLVSGKGPTLVHIQTAHGNYEAQKKVQAILHELKNQYGFDLVLVEGSSFKLEPELFRHPTRKDLTEAVADELAKEALFKGHDLFLIEEKGAEGYGIENLESYLANGDSFVAVLQEEGKSENFLRDMDMQIERLTSPYLNKDLRSFLKQQERFESKTLPFMEWLSSLKTEAKKHLKIDLSDPAFQLDWPMLLRVFKLKDFEARLDAKAFVTEKEKFLADIRQETGDRSPEHGGDLSSVSDRVTRLLSSPLAGQPLPDPETELLFEKMVAGLPADFNYDAYPNVKIFIGHLILQSELKGVRLVEEMNRITDLISKKLARTEEEKKILTLLKDHWLLKRLFALQLTPEDYEAIASTTTPSLRGVPPQAGRRSNLKPSEVIRRFQALNGTGRVRDVEFTHTGELDSLYDKALEFYRGVKERDEWMIQNVEARLKETGKDKAVVITGGFHAGPFQDHFATQGYNYALIAPKITTTDGHDAYVRAVFEIEKGLPSPIHSATRELVETLHGLGSLNALGVAKDRLAAQMLRAIHRSLVRLGRKAVAHDELRSELRAIPFTGDEGLGIDVQRQDENSLKVSSKSNQFPSFTAKLGTMTVETRAETRVISDQFIFAPRSEARPVKKKSPVPYDEELESGLQKDRVRALSDRSKVRPVQSNPTVPYSEEAESELQKRLTSMGRSEVRNEELSAISPQPSAKAESRQLKADSSLRSEARQVTGAEEASDLGYQWSELNADTWPGLRLGDYVKVPEEYVTSYWRVTAFEYSGSRQNPGKMARVRIRKISEQENGLGAYRDIYGGEPGQLIDIGQITGKGYEWSPGIPTRARVRGETLSQSMIGYLQSPDDQFVEELGKRSIKAEIGPSNKKGEDEVTFKLTPRALEVTAGTKADISEWAMKIRSPEAALTAKAKGILIGLADYYARQERVERLVEGIAKSREGQKNAFTDREGTVALVLKEALLSEGLSEAGKVELAGVARDFLKRNSRFFDRNPGIAMDLLMVLISQRNLTEAGDFLTLGKILEREIKDGLSQYLAREVATAKNYLVHLTGSEDAFIKENAAAALKQATAAPRSEVRSLLEVSREERFTGLHMDFKPAAITFLADEEVQVVGGWLQYSGTFSREAKITVSEPENPTGGSFTVQFIQGESFGALKLRMELNLAIGGIGEDTYLYDADDATELNSKVVQLLNEIKKREFWGKWVTKALASPRRSEVRKREIAYEDIDHNVEVIRYPIGDNKSKAALKVNGILRRLGVDVGKPLDVVFLTTDAKEKRASTVHFGQVQFDVGTDQAFSYQAGDGNFYPYLALNISGYQPFFDLLQQLAQEYPADRLLFQGVVTKAGPIFKKMIEKRVRAQGPLEWAIEDFDGFTKAWLEIAPFIPGAEDYRKGIKAEAEPGKWASWTRERSSASADERESVVFAKAEGGIRVVASYSSSAGESSGGSSTTLLFKPGSIQVESSADAEVMGLGQPFSPLKDVIQVPIPLQAIRFEKKGGLSLVLSDAALKQLKQRQISLRNVKLISSAAPRSEVRDKAWHDTRIKSLNRQLRQLSRKQRRALHKMVKTSIGSVEARVVDDQIHDTEANMLPLQVRLTRLRELRKAAAARSEVRSAKKKTEVAFTDEEWEKQNLRITPTEPAALSASRADTRVFTIGEMEEVEKELARIKLRAAKGRHGAESHFANAESHLEKIRNARSRRNRPPSWESDETVGKAVEDAEKFIAGYRKRSPEESRSEVRLDIEKARKMVGEEDWNTVSKGLRAVLATILTNEEVAALSPRVIVTNANHSKIIVNHPSNGKETISFVISLGFREEGYSSSVTYSGVDSEHDLSKVIPSIRNVYGNGEFLMKVKEQLGELSKNEKWNNWIVAAAARSEVRGEGENEIQDFIASLFDPKNFGAASNQLQALARDKDVRKSVIDALQEVLSVPFVKWKSDPKEINRRSAVLRALREIGYSARGVAPTLRNIVLAMLQDEDFLQKAEQTPPPASPEHWFVSGLFTAIATIGIDIQDEDQDGSAVREVLMQAVGKGGKLTSMDAFDAYVRVLRNLSRHRPGFPDVPVLPTASELDTILAAAAKGEDGRFANGVAAGFTKEMLSGWPVDSEPLRVLRAKLNAGIPEQVKAAVRELLDRHAAARSEVGRVTKAQVQNLIQTTYYAFQGEYETETGTPLLLRLDDIKVELTKGENPRVTVSVKGIYEGREVVGPAQEAHLILKALKTAFLARYEGLGYRAFDLVTHGWPKKMPNPTVIFNLQQSSGPIRSEVRATSEPARTGTTIVEKGPAIKPPVEITASSYLTKIEESTMGPKTAVNVFSLTRPIPQPTSEIEKVTVTFLGGDFRKREVTVYLFPGTIDPQQYYDVRNVVGARGWVYTVETDGVVDLTRQVIGELAGTKDNVGILRVEREGVEEAKGAPPEIIVTVTLRVVPRTDVRSAAGQLSTPRSSWSPIDETETGRRSEARMTEEEIRVAREQVIAAQEKITAVLGRLQQAEEEATLSQKTQSVDIYRNFVGNVNASRALLTNLRDNILSMRLQPGGMPQVTPEELGWIAEAEALDEKIRRAIPITQVGPPKKPVTAAPLSERSLAGQVGAPRSETRDNLLLLQEARGQIRSDVIEPARVGRPVAEDSLKRIKGMIGPLLSDEFPEETKALALVIETVEEAKGGAVLFAPVLLKFKELGPKGVAVLADELRLFARVVRTPEEAQKAPLPALVSLFNQEDFIASLIAQFPNIALLVLERKMLEVGMPPLPGQTEEQVTALQIPYPERLRQLITVTNRRQIAASAVFDTLKQYFGAESETEVSRMFRQITSLGFVEGPFGARAEVRGEELSAVGLQPTAEKSRELVREATEALVTAPEPVAATGVTGSEKAVTSADFAQSITGAAAEGEKAPVTTTGAVTTGPETKTAVTTVEFESAPEPVSVPEAPRRPAKDKPEAVVPSATPAQVFIIQEITEGIIFLALIEALKPFGQKAVSDFVSRLIGREVALAALPAEEAVEAGVSAEVMAQAAESVLTEAYFAALEAEASVVKSDEVAGLLIDQASWSQLSNKTKFYLLRVFGVKQRAAKVERALVKLVAPPQTSEEEVLAEIERMLKSDEIADLGIEAGIPASDIASRLGKLVEVIPSVAGEIPAVKQRLKQALEANEPVATMVSRPVAAALPVEAMNLLLDNKELGQEAALARTLAPFLAAKVTGVAGRLHRTQLSGPKLLGQVAAELLKGEVPVEVAFKSIGPRGINILPKYLATLFSKLLAEKYFGKFA